LFYIDDPNHLVLQKGDLVVVEADRGKDLGKCLTSCTLDEVREFQMHQVESALGQLAANAGGGPTIGGITPVPLPPGQQPTAAAIARMTKEIHPKKIYGRASPADVALLAVKAQDEAKALNVCRAKVVQHQLPMEVTDAEFQL
jgi:cell fate regulator YaaT (PSP1 superfamily)